jgi:sRNA-binding protein
MISKQECNVVLQLDKVKATAKEIGLEFFVYSNHGFQLKKKIRAYNHWDDPYEFVYGADTLDKIEGWMAGVTWAEQQAKEKRQRKAERARKKAAKKKKLVKKKPKKKMLKKKTKMAKKLRAKKAGRKKR